MKASDIKATLSFSNGGDSVELPIYKGTVGPDVIDIRKLYAQTGMFTYDPGFMSTAACQSAITYIDGDKGELLYRGYPIEQLATNCDFLETCHLLLYGELPDQAGHDGHWMRVAAEAAQEELHLLVDHGVVGHELGEVGFLGGVGQLTVQQQVAGFHEVAVGGQLLDGVAAVQQLALVAIDVGDGGLARGGGQETRVVGEHAGLGIELADIHDIRPHVALVHR